MVRRQILNIKVSSYGCNIYYTCSPCVGTDISSGNYTNPTSSNLPVQNRGVEVKNQVSDYDYQRDVLLLKNSVDLITTHNADYSQTLNNKLRQEMDRANMSGLSMQLRRFIPNVENHIQSTAHDMLKLLKAGGTLDNEVLLSLKSTFKELTGIDIAGYINKSNLTLQDQEILNMYNEFCDGVLYKMQKDYARDPKNENIVLEMATYALHVYNDEGGEGYGEWCVPLRDVSTIPSIEERISAQKILDFLSENNNKHDFQADFYYDKDKDKYVLAFRGTESKFEAIPKGMLNELPVEIVNAIKQGTDGIASLSVEQMQILTSVIENNQGDWGSDILYLYSGKSPQHDIAAALGELVKESGIPLDKLTITGHSLGGGLALLAGMKSGAETYTYDPLHLNSKAVEIYDVNTEEQSHIHCYTEKNEMLVRGGEIAINTMVNVSEASKTATYSEVGIDDGYGLNSILKPVSVGDVTIVEIPDKDYIFPYIPYILNTTKEGGSASRLNHSMIDMLNGVSALDHEKTTNFINGQNMRHTIAECRAKKRYEQRTSTINITNGDLEFTVISR